MDWRKKLLWFFLGVTFVIVVVGSIVIVKLTALQKKYPFIKFL